MFINTDISPFKVPLKLLKTELSGYKLSAGPGFSVVEGNQFEISSVSSGK